MVAHQGKKSGGSAARGLKAEVTPAAPNAKRTKRDLRRSLARSLSEVGSDRMAPRAALANAGPAVLRKAGSSSEASFAGTGYRSTSTAASGVEVRLVRTPWLMYMTDWSRARSLVSSPSALERRYRG